MSKVRKKAKDAQTALPLKSFFFVVSSLLLGVSCAILIPIFSFHFSTTIYNPDSPKWEWAFWSCCSYHTHTLSLCMSFSYLSTLRLSTFPSPGLSFSLAIFLWFCFCYVFFGIMHGFLELGIFILCWIFVILKKLASWWYWCRNFRTLLVSGWGNCTFELLVNIVLRWVLFYGNPLRV